jgi:uncharacterized small protein (DUF1192 family)
MFDDRPMPKKLIPLDQMSIEDLEQRIIDLQAQITDVEEIIQKKKTAARKAHSVFKS